MALERVSPPSVSSPRHPVVQGIAYECRATDRSATTSACRRRRRDVPASRRDRVHRIAATTRAAPKTSTPDMRREPRFEPLRVSDRLCRPPAVAPSSSSSSMVVPPF